MLCSLALKSTLRKFLNVWFIKGYFHYKIIFCHKVAHDVWLMNFLFEEKIILCSQEIYRFLCFGEIHRFQNLWCHHRHCYIMEVMLMLISFESQVLSKWILVKYYCAVWQTFLTYYWLDAGDWKLVPGPFLILLKCHYREIWPFLTVDTCHL